VRAAAPGLASGGAVARLLLAGAILCGSPRASAESIAPTGCDATGAAPVLVAAVDENFDLLLGDGRIATLSGVEFLSPPIAPRALLAWLDERDLRAKPLSTAPDRWGRIPVRLYLQPREVTDAAIPDPVMSDAAMQALRMGWGRYRPDSGAGGCRAALLAAEGEAREKRTGLWADASSILHGDDRQALASAPPAMQVAEGVVQSVGAARGRIYLNLGKMRTADLAIVIVERNISAFAARGVDARKLAGHRIRVRGLLDRRFGPQIEITSPDALEILEVAGPDSRSGEARGRTD
jgi:hypothetical protein